jgi:uncharacterized protein (TIGR00251 family)
MLDLQTHPDGVILPVRAQPGGRRNAIRGLQNGMLKVSVTQIAEKGKANKALVDLLCRQLGLRKSEIELLSGETAHEKRFLIRHITATELAARIEAAMAPDTGAR